MDRKARNQYMNTLRKRYLQASKKDKGQMLDEYCRNTGQDRKYVIKKFRQTVRVKKEGTQGKEKNRRKPRKETYDGPVKAALVCVWKIFDFPCGQRLAPILCEETNRLRILKELICSDETARKLREMVPSTIDAKLKHEKEVERGKRKYVSKRNSLLCTKVPTKTAAELDRENPGVVQIDFVENCGVSVRGEYVNSLSVTDICSGWWEGEAVMGKGQERALEAINETRIRSPFAWKEMHPDNGGNIMNYHVYAYSQKNKIALSRSRPYKKNDNCFVEQKNSTHVRQVVGYRRYDSKEEQNIINDLYRHELRLYKNFFQPVMKLTKKYRVAGKIKKKYDTPKTPYRRLMESERITKKQKKELKQTYESLNPGNLKRSIDMKLHNLAHAYDKKNKSQRRIDRPLKQLRPSTVSYYIGQPV